MENYYPPLWWWVICAYVIFIDQDLVDGIGAREARLSLFFDTWNNDDRYLRRTKRQQGEQSTWLCHHGKVVGRDIPHLMAMKHLECFLRNPKWRERDWLWQNALSVMVPRAKRVAHCLLCFVRRCLSRGYCIDEGKTVIRRALRTRSTYCSICRQPWCWGTIGLQLYTGHLFKQSAVLRMKHGSGAERKISRHGPWSVTERVRGK